MSEKPLIEMLNEYLEWLDDDDNPIYPDWMGGSDWVDHDDGGSEDWGDYLLRLSVAEREGMELVPEGTMGKVRDLLCGDCEARVDILLTDNSYDT